jgi:transcriptional regulator with XRE-family HTH domain
MMPAMRKTHKTFSEQVRRLIEASGQTRYRICMETGIDQATMSRFMNGTGILSTNQLDALANLLHWRIGPELKAATRSRTKPAAGKTKGK